MTVIDSLADLFLARTPIILLLTSIMSKFILAIDLKVGLWPSCNYDILADPEGLYVKIPQAQYQLQ